MPEEPRGFSTTGTTFRKEERVPHALTPSAASTLGISSAYTRTLFVDVLLRLRTTTLGPPSQRRPSPAWPGSTNSAHSGRRLLGPTRLSRVQRPDCDLRSRHHRRYRSTRRTRTGLVQSQRFQKTQSTIPCHLFVFYSS